MKFSETGYLLRVNFYRPSFFNQNNGKTIQNDPINDPINLFDLIKQNPYGSYEDYAVKLHISAATVKRKIAELNKGRRQNYPLGLK